MVKVGNSEWGFLKLTPLSRTSAMTGAVSGVTFNARNPSGTNRIRLRGVLFCADAVPADSSVRPADRRTIERRIKISLRADFQLFGRCLCLVFVCDGFVTSVPGRLPDNYALSEIPRLGHLPQNKTSAPAWSEQGNRGTPAGDRHPHSRLRGRARQICP